MDTTYNGWTNYETWCVSLWLSNDEGPYNDTRQLAVDAQELLYPQTALVDCLKVYVDELPEMTAVTEGPASFITDLLGAALGEVNWFEIAENLLSELPDAP